jgi:hypothetical protein
MAAFAKTFSEHQIRALRFRRNKKTGKPRFPGVTTFFRILNEVDELALAEEDRSWVQTCKPCAGVALARGCRWPSSGRQETAGKYQAACSHRGTDTVF